jgi:hypothetical protein
VVGGKYLNRIVSVTDASVGWLTSRFHDRTARFDVYRHQSKRFCYAVVKEVDFTYDRNRILFHFTKTQDKFDEWIEFGSPRICAFKSKVVTKKDKQVQNDENTLSMEKKLSIEAASISKSILRQEPALEIQDTVFRRTSLEPDVLFPQVSEASDTNENPQGDAASPATVERIESPAFAVSDSALFEQTGRRSSLAHDVIPVVHPSLHSVTAKADHLVAPSGSNVWQTSSDHFSDMNICRYANVQGYAGEHSFGSMASATHVSNMKPRPPDFITAGREPTLDFASHNHSNNFSEGQMMWNSSAMNDARFASSAVGLSGLDILAAVTHHHALGSSSAAMEMCTNGTANNQAHGFGQPLFHREQAHDVVHGFAPKQQQQHPHPSSSMGHPTNGCLPFSGSQFGWQ